MSWWQTFKDVMDKMSFRESLFLLLVPVVVFILGTIICLLVFYKKKSGKGLKVTPYNFFMTLFDPEGLKMKRYEKFKLKPYSEEVDDIDQKKRVQSLQEMQDKITGYSELNKDDQENLKAQFEAHKIAMNEWCTKTLNFQLKQLDVTKEDLSCVPKNKEQCEALMYDTHSLASTPTFDPKTGLLKKYTVWMDSRCIVMGGDSSQICSSLSVNSCVNNYRQSECKNACAMFDRMTRSKSLGSKLNPKLNKFYYAYTKATSDSSTNPMKEKLQNPFNYPDAIRKFIKDNDFNKMYPDFLEEFEDCLGCQKRVDNDIGLENCSQFATDNVVGTEQGDDTEQNTFEQLNKIKMNNCLSKNAEKIMKFDKCKDFGDKFEVMTPQVECDNRGNCYPVNGSYFNCRISEEYCAKFDLDYDPLPNNAGECIEESEIAKQFENVFGTQMVRKRLRINQDIKKYCSDSRKNFTNGAMCALKHAEYIDPLIGVTESLVNDVVDQVGSSLRTFFNTGCKDLGPLLYQSAMKGIRLTKDQLPKGWESYTESELKSECAKCMEALYSLNPTYLEKQMQNQMFIGILGMVFPDEVASITEDEWAAINQITFAMSDVDDIPFSGLVIYLGTEFLLGFANMDKQYHVSFKTFARQQIKATTKTIQELYEDFPDKFNKIFDQVREVSDIVTKIPFRAAKFVFDQPSKVALATLRLSEFFFNLGMYPVNCFLNEFERWGAELDKYNLGWIQYFGLWQAKMFLRFLDGLAALYIGIEQLVEDVIKVAGAVRRTLFHVIGDVLCLFGLLC